MHSRCNGLHQIPIPPSMFSTRHYSAQHIIHPRQHIPSQPIFERQRYNSPVKVQELAFCLHSRMPLLSRRTHRRRQAIHRVIYSPLAQSLRLHLHRQRRVLTMTMRIATRRAPTQSPICVGFVAKLTHAQAHSKHTCERTRVSDPTGKDITVIYNSRKC